MGGGSCAASPASRGADARTLVAAVLAHIRTGEYIYTLEPGHLRQAMPWTSSGSTASSAFASTSPPAFVVVMRALDVPARVVTGYQGADAEPADGYYIVRQSNAHAWAEFWQPGERLGARRPDRGGVARPHRAAARAWRRAQGFVAGALSSVRPGSCGPAARAHGSGQQPLEPVGAELLARPAVRPAAKAWAWTRRAWTTCCSC